MNTILDPLKMTDQELEKWIPVFEIQISSIKAELESEEISGFHFTVGILKDQLEEKEEQLRAAKSTLESRQISLALKHTQIMPTIQEIIDPNKLSDRDLDWYIASLFLKIKASYENLYDIWMRNRSSQEADIVRESIKNEDKKLKAALEVDHFRRESMR